MGAFGIQLQPGRFSLALASQTSKAQGAAKFRGTCGTKSPVGEQTLIPQMAGSRGGDQI